MPQAFEAHCKQPERFILGTLCLSNPSRMIDVLMDLGYLWMSWNKIKVKGGGGFRYGFEIFSFSGL